LKEAPHKNGPNVSIGLC